MNYNHELPKPKVCGRQHECPNASQDKMLNARLMMVSFFQKKVMTEELVNKLVDVKDYLAKLKTFYLRTEYPDHFENICKQAGVENLFSSLLEAMTSYRMSHQRQGLPKLRAMVVIYIMLYFQSQRGNRFQISLARTLQKFGLSQQGLAFLCNLGIVAHPRTIKATMQIFSESQID